MTELTEYERERLANIERNKALLKQLELAQPEHKAPRSAPAPKPKATPRTRTPRTKRDSPAPQRTSARLQGITATSEVIAKRAAEEEAAERLLKKTRMRGEHKFADILAESSRESWESAQKMFTGWPAAIVADVVEEGAKTSETEVENVSGQESDEKELAELREKIGGLKLYERWEPNQIRITPERIYHIGMHPDSTRKLVLAGDKTGVLGIWDADSQREAAEEDEEDAAELPLIHQFRPHNRTISFFTFSPTNAQKLYTTSYDASVRVLDLQAGTSTEIFAPGEDEDEDEAPLISACEITPEGNVVYISDFAGRVHRYDTRAPRTELETFQCHDKKIGGMSMHPLAPWLVVTSSNERSLRVWDFRKIETGDEGGRHPWMVGEYVTDKSISSAYWNRAGQIAATSYDDTITIFSEPTCTTWSPGSEDLGAMTPSHKIPHDNQVGRWVTIFRAQWHQNPGSGVQKVCIGNMRRNIDVYSRFGERVGKLGEGDARITAVPAAVQWHPREDWVVGGTSSGKVVFYQ